MEYVRNAGNLKLIKEDQSIDQPYSIVYSIFEFSTVCRSLTWKQTLQTKQRDLFLLLTSHKSGLGLGTAHPDSDGDRMSCDQQQNGKEEEEDEEGDVGKEEEEEEDDVTISDFSINKHE